MERRKVADPILAPVEHDPWDPSTWNVPQGSSAPVHLMAGLGNALRQVWGENLQSSKDIPGQLLSGATLSHDVMTGEADLSTPEGQKRLRTLTSLVPVGGVARMVGAGAEEGTLGIFGGKLAKTANLDMLAQAEGLAKQGASREDIYSKTGWFRGTDSKWRFEIPDTNAKMTGMNDFPAGMVMEHPELYEAYPQLADYHVGSIGPNAHIEGSFNRSSKSFLLKNREDRETMLHEMQHGVQDIEGFQRGGSIQTGNEAMKALPQTRDIAKLSAAKTIKNAEYLKVENAADKFLQTSAWDDQSKDEIKKLAALPMEKLNDLHKRYSELIPSDVHTAYNRLAGETEARNVSTRSNLSTNVLQTKAPWETEDVPRSSQILQGRGGKFSLVPVSHDPFEGQQ